MAGAAGVETSGENAHVFVVVLHRVFMKRMDPVAIRIDGVRFYVDHLARVPPQPTFSDTFDARLVVNFLK